MSGRYGSGQGRGHGGRPDHRGRTGGRRPGRNEPPRIHGRRDDARLAAELRDMSGASYGRYKSLQGDWDYGDFTLTVDRVQSDPFAPPSRVSVLIPADVAELPDSAWRSPVRRRATADFLARRAYRVLKGSRLRIDVGGQEVIDRASVQIEEGDLRLRLGIELPGHGRRIDGRTAEHELCDRLPDLVDALRWPELDTRAAVAFADTVEDTTALRDRLPDLGLVAFVADGSVLPRRSGVSDLPMDGEGNAVPFASPTASGSPSASRTAARCGEWVYPRASPSSSAAASTASRPCCTPWSAASTTTSPATAANSSPPAPTP